MEMKAGKKSLCLIFEDHVVKVSTKYVDYMDHPMMIQPLEQHEVGNYFVDILPKCEFVPKDEWVDLSHDEKVEVMAAVANMREQLGKDFPVYDWGYHNVGQLNGEWKVIDGGCFRWPT